ncbi:MAG: pseudouridine synthase [Crocinitomicaceae bacterium]
MEILFQDEHFVAVNKPAGLLVHRSAIAKDATEFALQKTRDLVRKEVHPIHRLDRKTSGVLLFAFELDTLRLMQQVFNEGEVRKEYHAIVRGFTQDSGEIDYALVNDKGTEQSALTNYTTHKRWEIDKPFGKHKTSRYSYVHVFPVTGRMHQIRKHFAHIFHPIIGDRPHGCNKQNKFFKEEFDLSEMLLHARSYSFQHPITKEQLRIEAPMRDEFDRIINILNELRINN